MDDLVFGALEYDDACSCWNGTVRLNFFGAETQLNLMVMTSYEDAEPPQESQYETFRHFSERWPELQAPLSEALIQYYNQYEYRSYGPGNEEDMKQWWPEIHTTEALLQQITLEALVIQPAFLMRDVYGGARSLFLLFSHRWGNDLDGNGIGVHLIDEEISEVGFQSIAF